MKRLFMAGVIFELGLLIVGLTWVAPFAHRAKAGTPCPPVSLAAPTVTPSHGPAPNNVAVTLDQWSVTPSATTLAAGRVAFTVVNVGAVTHELVVLMTDTPGANIPIAGFEGEPNRINEDTAGTNVGETGDMKLGLTKTLSLDLQPGHYVFLCNLPAHYGLGMHVDVTVAAA